MNQFAALTFPSNNKKTGPIAVSTTSRNTCPLTCSLAGDQGCYANSGYHTRLHWNLVTSGERGATPEHFIRQVGALPRFTMLRHCVAGDQFINCRGQIDLPLLLELAQAARHLTASWTYTHHHVGQREQSAIQAAAQLGFTLNASTESLSSAATLHKNGIPAVCVVPQDTPPTFEHDGVRFVQCPATRQGSAVQCISCGGRHGKPLCAQPNRPFVVTFPAHGPKREAAESHCST